MLIRIDRIPPTATEWDLGELRKSIFGIVAMNPIGQEEEETVIQFSRDGENGLIEVGIFPDTSVSYTPALDLRDDVTAIVSEEFPSHTVKGKISCCSIGERTFKPRF